MKKKHILLDACVASLALLFTAISSSASILLSSKDFALLGGTAITSTGVVGTAIRNGNVGLSPGATTGITGFPPATVTNGAIIATGGVTGQGRLDIIQARTGLANMASNKNMTDVDLGGKTLKPGVYTFRGAATQSGDLVLDAQGRNGAFWVFQISTTLTTSINSAVRIINLGSGGGRDCGVFWNAGSAINIGGNNTILGNYLSGTSVTMGGLSNGGGRVLALAAITLDNNQINAKGGPGGADWSGGLKYSASGAVVPDPDLAFSYLGNSTRTVTTSKAYIYGKGTATVAYVQWRLNGGNWHNVLVQYEGRWQFDMLTTLLQAGPNVLEIRARDAHGNATEIQEINLIRPS